MNNKNDNKLSSSLETRGQKLDIKQTQIYKGLKEIGPEISEFYLDGIKVINNNLLKSKANIIAHLAREIDAGLREIFAKKEEKERIQKEYNLENGHIASILASIKCDPDYPYAKKWFDIARNFARIAHHERAYREVKDFSEMSKLWCEYEEILFWFLGSYYKLLDRIDRILKYDKPSNEIIESLIRILKVDARYTYFFNNLKSPKWLKSLHEADFFNPENNPLPIENPKNKGSFFIPFWSALFYLEKISNIDPEKLSDEIIVLIIKIVEDIAEYKDENDNRIDNSRTDYFLVKILFSLPIERITEKHIQYLKPMLYSKWRSTLVESEIGKTIIPKLISNSCTNLIKELLIILFDFTLPKKDKNSEFQSTMDKYWLNDAINKNKTGIAQLCSLEAGQIALNKIEEIISIDDSQFNTIWIPTIEDHPQNRFPDRYECQLVHFVRDMFESSNPEEIKHLIEDMLSNTHSIFKRLAIYLINYHYDSLKNIFWNYDGNPLKEYMLEHELFELFRNNCSKFTEEEIDKTLNWIETKEYYVSGKNKDNSDTKNKILAYRKKAWLISLLDSRNPKILEAYETYDKIDPTQIEHPGFVSWSSSMIGSVSPLKINQLNTMSIDEIVEFLIKFKSERGWAKPSIDGLTNTLQSYVMENPEKISENLDSFLKVRRVYQHSILQGFIKAINKSRIIEWHNLLNFAKSIIDSENFWTEKYDNGYNDYRKWIVSLVADLINEGTKNDKTAFDPKLLPLSESMLLKLYEKSDYEMFYSLNLVTSVLNSTIGRIFSAMVNFSLRVARLSGKDEDRWNPEIKSVFDKLIHLEPKPSIEFYVVLGQFLPNLMYLDEVWVIKNINLIFPKESEEHWKASFNGYLFYCSRIFDNIFTLLRKNEHYEIAIYTDFNDEEINKALVQHICVGYLEEWEDIDNPKSLISQLLRNGNVKQISEIVRFCWVMERTLTNKDKSKILILWNKITKYINELQDITEEHTGILSDLSKWIIFIDEIDSESLELLLLSAKYLEQNYNTSEFVENLLKHAENTPDKVAEIYLFMLSNNIYPYYDQKHIINTIQYLYDNGLKEAANEICNKYGSKGYDFLRSSYTKNNNLVNELQ
ncbi:MAG: hypothetical protein ACTSWK_04200 [Promethearchaeota archaeon]